MTQNEIIEGNRIIAKFMGAKEDYYPKELPNWFECFGKWEDNLLKFEYHSSFDFIMPVVEKISKIEFHREMEDNGGEEPELIIYTHYPRTFGMLNKEGKPMVRLNSCALFEADTLIEATYLAVVDFCRTA